jgi:ribosomal protein L29
MRKNTLTKEEAKAFKTELKAMTNEQLEAKRLELKEKYKHETYRSHEETLLNSEIYSRR